MRPLTLMALAAGPSYTSALFGVQNTTFNATHGPFNEQTAMARIAQANLTEELAYGVLQTLDFERTNWAGTSVHLDRFYTELPSNWSTLPAGSIIKVEEKTNTSLYTVVPGVAMSRMLFTTRNFNGTVIPASGFVLWPYMPRRFGGERLPLITWAHGTSGSNGECGPSHIRNNWYQFMITAAATRGFVVVAPDYAGLGLDHDGRNNTIPHQYLANKASGYDLIYAAKAAQEAWPTILDERYAILGHSQGGGAAWGAANVLGSDNPEASELRRGYLGTVPVSPFTGLFNSLSATPYLTPSILLYVSAGLKAMFPSFELSDWLTDKGAEMINLVQDLGACAFTATVLVGQDGLVRTDWNSSWYASAWDKLTTTIARPFAGPMLVVSGSADPTMNFTTVANAVKETCSSVPGAQLEFVELEGVEHDAAMSVGQDVILEWIADRFRGRLAPAGCCKRTITPLLPAENYQAVTNWLLVWATP